MLRDYVEGSYLPAAAAGRRRGADGARVARELAAWWRHVADHWDAVRFGPLAVRRADGRWVFEVRVDLGEISPAAARVELYADPVDGGPGLCVPMERVGDVHRAEAPAARPAGDYTPRVVAVHPEARVPAEAALVRWQR
jgi:starch phosphorylase